MLTEVRFGKEIITTTKGDSNKRPDFIMLHFGKSIVIVEIKKKGYKLRNDEFENIREYYERTVDFLESNLAFKDPFPDRSNGKTNILFQGERGWGQIDVTMLES